MANVGPFYVYDDLLKYGTYSNSSLWPDHKALTIDEIMKNIEAVKAEMATPANCTTCGTWGGCVCKRVDMLRGDVCYLCSVGVSADGAIQRSVLVCPSCVRRYL